MSAAALALAALLAVAPAAPEREAGAGAIDAVAETVARAAAALAPPEATRLALRVEGPRRLASAAELAVAASLRAAHFPPPLPSDEAGEADARLELRIDLAGGELVVAGELRPLRENFFTGRALVAGGALAARAPADPAVRLLAGALPLSLEVRPFARLAEAPLALAIGVLDGAPFVAALLNDQLLLLDEGGALRARYQLPAPREGARPARDPRAGLVIAGGRIRWVLPARGAGEILRFDGERLWREGDASVDLLPLAAGPAGILSAELAEGTNLFAPLVLLGDGGEVAAPRAIPLPSPFVAALASFGGGWGVVDPDGRFHPLFAEGASVADVGDAAALADLDGDGEAELLASLRVTAPPDRIRLLRPGAAPIESGPVDGLLVVATSGILGGGEAAIFAADDGTLYLARRAP